jgi:hypothetical protein
MPKDYSMGPFFATIDTAMMGRKTFDAAHRWQRMCFRVHVRPENVTELLLLMSLQRVL